MKTPRGLAAAVALAVMVVARALADTAQVNATATDQVIRGFGGATVFYPTTPLVGSDLDSLFENGPGQIGLTLMRIRVASDDAWRAVELSNAQGAVARNANVIATPWSPPASMKDNNNIIGGDLIPSSYGAYASYLNDFANYMASNGAPLYAISIQNEPDISVTYESCDWTADQLHTFCANDAGAITATKVIMPESFQYNHAMSDPTLNDPTAAGNINIVGGHIYGGGLAPYPLAVAMGKEVWMTEHEVTTTDWPDVLATGKEIHDCLATANFNAYIWWYLKRYYGPLGEDGTVTQRGYVMAQFAKFIRPGYFRVDATANPNANIYVSAYIGQTLVIVAINLGSTDMTQAFSISNATVNSVSPWVTSNTLNLAAQPAIQVTGGSFTATLPASSVTTFVGNLPLAPRPPQVSVAPADGTNQIVDLSTRGYTAPGPAVITGGFVITGPANTTKTVLLRGVAYSLYQYGIQTPLAKPLLTVFDGKGNIVATETTQQSEADLFTGNAKNPSSKLRPVFNQVGAFDFVPTGNGGTNVGDTAIVLTLAPGQYTFTISGAPDTVATQLAVGAQDGSGDSWAGSNQPNATAGIVLLEVYDVSVSDGGKLINISTRGEVMAGQAEMVAGFVVSGTGHKRLLVRADGPVLGGYGVSNTLGDPYLAVFNSSGGTLITDAGWDYGAQGVQIAQVAAANGAFAFPDPSADSAAIVLVPPGQYTASVQSVSSASGIALVEVYDTP